MTIDNCLKRTTPGDMTDNGELSYHKRQTAEWYPGYHVKQLLWPHLIRDPFVVRELIISRYVPAGYVHAVTVHLSGEGTVRGGGGRARTNVSHL